MAAHILVLAVLIVVTVGLIGLLLGMASGTDRWDGPEIL